MPDRSDAARQGGSLPAQDELLERIRALEQSLRARDDLLAVAAHELRNPMHSLLLQVSAALQIARRREDAEMQLRLERIKNVVDRYVKRATVLLDAARHQAHRFQLQVEHCDFARILTEIVDSYAAEAAFNRSELTLEAPVTLKGHWDRLGLEQIASNLILNAIKYGAGKPVTVRLLADTDAVELQVIDHGIGIAPADQERIFEQFERAVGSDEARSGFGIGLWLVRNLVLAHGGTIDVQSESQQGATFIVTLPRECRTAD